MMWQAGAQCRSGTPERVIAFIRATYGGTNSHVQPRDEISKILKSKAESARVAFFSPILFLFAIGDVLQPLPGGRGGVESTMSSFPKRLDYADGNLKKSIFWNHQHLNGIHPKIDCYD